MTYTLLIQVVVEVRLTGEVNICSRFCNFACNVAAQRKRGRGAYGGKKEEESKAQTVAGI